jgi:hypothetical protein
MRDDKDIDTIEVSVTYAGSRKGPWEHAYEPTAQLSRVRGDAMAYFEVADSADAAGNQILYKLMHGANTLNDLTRTVGAEAGERDRLELRLVREVIAG